MEACSRCGSHDAVKRSSVTAGLESQHEFLCRPCRFEVSVVRRNQKVSLYKVTFSYKGSSVVQQATVKATSAGEAIRQVIEDHETIGSPVKWREVYCLQLVRSNK